MRCRKEQQSFGCYLFPPHYHVRLQKDALENTSAEHLVWLCDHYQLFKAGVV